MLYRSVPSKLDQIAFGFSIKKSCANHFSIRICAALPRKGIFGYSQSQGISDSLSVSVADRRGLRNVRDPDSVLRSDLFRGLRRSHAAGLAIDLSLFRDAGADLSPVPPVAAVKRGDDARVRGDKSNMAAQSGLDRVDFAASAVRRPGGSFRIKPASALAARRRRAALPPPRAEIRRAAADAANRPRRWGRNPWRGQCCRQAEARSR